MVNEKLVGDHELLTQLSQSAETAFAAIYRKYSPRLYFKLLKIVKSKIFVEEIMQDVFLAIWENRSKIDPTKYFQSYINCIAVNKCYDHFRKIAREKKMNEKFTKDNTFLFQSDDFSHSIEDEAMINEMIEKLPPRRRMIFKMCKIDGKTYEEVSNQLGISLSTISDHIVKANFFIRTEFSHAVW